MENQMPDVSQPESTNQTTTDSPKRIPAWAAGAGAIAFLAVAGFFIYWFMGGSFVGSSDLIPDPTRAQQQPGRGNWRQQANADGVQPIPNRGWFVRSGPAFMDVEVPQDKKQPPTFRFRYDSQSLLTPDQWHLALGLRRIGQDAQMAKTLDVSQDQLDRLRRFTAVPMEIPKADRDRLVAAWADYDKATAKADPEKKLLAALKEAGAKSLPATKAHAVQRIAEISSILTPDQVRELTKLGAGQNVTPITPRIQPTAHFAKSPLPAATTRPTTRRSATTRPV